MKLLRMTIASFVIGGHAAVPNGNDRLDRSLAFIDYRRRSLHKFATAGPHVCARGKHIGRLINSFSR